MLVKIVQNLKVVVLYLCSLEGFVPALDSDGIAKPTVSFSLIETSLLPTK
jgi:hypothetical protein